jgi:hypothetical protein
MSRVIVVTVVLPDEGDEIPAVSESVFTQHAGAPSYAAVASALHCIAGELDAKDRVGDEVQTGEGRTILLGREHLRSGQIDAIGVRVGWSVVA